MEENAITGGTAKESDPGEGRLVINGLELQFDLLDADHVERFHAADGALVERLNDDKTYEGLSQADQMRAQCRLIEDFFDALFGEGTSKAIFGENNNHIGKHTEAFRETMEYAMKAPEQIEKVTGRYSQKRLQNREQRRAAAKSADKPAEPKHYDNVTDITRRPKPAGVSGPESASGADDTLADVLEAEGLTREQFEMAVALAKSLQGGK